jgi:hypothetical protein
MNEAGPNEILVMSTVVQTMGAGARRFSPVGVRELRGIDEPRELHSLIDDTSMSQSKDHP